MAAKRPRAQLKKACEPPYRPPARGVRDESCPRIPRRTITAEQLKAIKTTHPIEGALAEYLIELGIWTLDESNGKLLRPR